MLIKEFSRLFHTTSKFLYSAAGPAIDKSSLSALRKKTGYTFTNCKKALELHNNDLKLAEHWLQQQAQSLGWSKATKLEGRSTKQGLVGILIQQNIGALVEVNCETDFVARNQQFQDFVGKALTACINRSHDIPLNGGLTKIEFDPEALKNLPISGKKLMDELALMIGSVGENATLRRGLCFKTDPTTRVTGYVHPGNVGLLESYPLFGKYGSLLAYKSNESIDGKTEKDLCQHIIGMNPLRIGERDKDEPAKEKDDETLLIYQEYLLDPDVTVDEYLTGKQIEIVDFQRYGCGESVAVADETVAVTN